MFNLKMIAFGVLGLAFVALTASTYFMYDTIQDQELSIVSLSKKAEDNAKAVVAMKQSVEDLGRQQEKSNNELSKVQGEFSKTQKSLESFIGRDNTVAKKPKLVERKIQASYDKFTTDFGCVTGGCK